MFIFGSKYFAKTKSAHFNDFFLCGTAKLAIWLTRKKHTQGGTVESVLVLEGFLKACLKVDYTYFKTMAKIEALKRPRTSQDYFL